MTEYSEEFRTHFGELSEYYDSRADILQKEVDSLHKWIMASCLTVNSGGIVLLVGIESIATRPTYFALLWFASGIVTAIGYAMVHNSVMTKTISHLRDVVRTFEAFGKGNTDDIDRDAVLGPLERLERAANYVDAAQYLSLICFIVGCSIVGAEYP